MSAGLGIGVVETFKFKGNPSLPVFARFHAEDFSRKFSPYLNFDLGYEAMFGDNAKGGLLINPVIGVRYNCFSFGLGYRGFKSTQSGSKMSNAIAINLGYTFGMHKSENFQRVIRALKKIEFSIATTALLGKSTGRSKENHKEYIYFPDYPSYSNVITTGKADFKHSQKYENGGMLSIAFTYPVWRNLYAGISGGAMVLTCKSDYETKLYDVNSNHEESVKVQYERDRESYGGYFSDDESAIDAFVAARLKYKLKEFTFAKRFYPYAQIDLGVSGFDGENKMYFSPEAGVSMMVGNRHSLDVGISYKPVVTEDNSEHMNEIAYKSSGHIGISVGFTF